jgi:hypothetical protein
MPEARRRNPEEETEKRKIWKDRERPEGIQRGLGE